MKVRNWKKKITRLLFVTLLVVIVGCQAVSGFDVNKALVEAVVAKSMEGKGEFTLNLIMDEKASTAPEQLAMLKLFENMKIKFDAIKMENSTRMSVKGSALLAKYNIPFEASVTAEQLVLKLEGGKKPIVLDLKGDSSSDTMPPFFTELQAKLSDGVLTSSMMSYFIKQLPNPSKLKVDTVNDLINGETVSLHKLHSEITGDELLPLAKAFIKNVLKDNQALKDLIGQVYDAVYPLIAAELDKAVSTISSEKDDYEDNDSYGYEEMTPYNSSPLGQVKSKVQPILTGIKAVLDDRDIAIEVIHTEVKQLFIIALVALESSSEESQQVLQKVFNKDSYVNSDLYFDNSFKLRKSNTVLMIAPQLQDTKGINAIKITMSMENWNVNGNVKADSIPTSGGSLTLDKESKPNDFVQNLDPKSAIYQLMKNDLGITKISFPLYLGTGKYIPYTQQPFIEKGVTMVPTRFISERLNAKVDWNSTTQAITVTDPETSRTIVLQGGSNIALVNGKKLEMEQEVLLRDDNSFVPLTFIVTQLGGKTQWNEETRSVQVTRE